MIHEPLIYAMSDEGKRAYRLPPLDVPEKKDLLVDLPARESIPDFPEVSEIEIVRHFTRLSQTNYCVDIGLYPLGSCTMKYNPKINEKIAGFEGLATVHPLADSDLSQGNLEIIWRLEQELAEITGLPHCSLQPSAGAQGELVGMMLIRACLEERGDPRKIVLIPDSAHGTNPSSAHLCGYRVQEVRSNEKGMLDLDDLEREMTDEVAAVMITNPNTLGVFETDICRISEIVHSRGGYVYMDGANMNALMGICRPGEMGVDVLHLNLHKTFSTPHGGGGPGSGPVCATEELAPYLPSPWVVKNEQEYVLDFDQPQSIGRVRAFYGNFLVAVKALTYILNLGPEGLKEVAEIAVLNSRYIRACLEGAYHLQYETPTLHECVFSDKLQKEHGVQNIDIAKRLIDFDLHPPTMSFPLIVPGALMIEPTETESKEDLDRFVNAMLEIAKEAKETPEFLKDAPLISYVRRLDETAAARNPILRWQPGQEE